MSTKLLAFHGNPGIKSKFCRRIRQHRKLDHLQRGHYWIPRADPVDDLRENGKPKPPYGCAVGCTLEMGSYGCDDLHSQFELQLGIPTELARLEDILFEIAPDRESAGRFAVDFLSAIPVGADLSGVGEQLIQDFDSPRWLSTGTSFMLKDSVGYWIMGDGKMAMTGFLVSGKQIERWQKVVDRLLRLFKAAPVPAKLVPKPTSAAKEAPHADQ